MHCSGGLHDDEDWEHWYYELAPDPQARHAHDFAKNRATELPRIIDAVPADVLTAAGTHESEPGYVAFVGGDFNEFMSWARSVRLEDGSMRYR